MGNKDSISVNNPLLAYNSKMSVNISTTNQESEQGFVPQISRLLCRAKLIWFLCGVFIALAVLPASALQQTAESDNTSLKPLIVSSGKLYSDLSQHLAVGFESDVALSIDNVESHIHWLPAPKKPDLVLGFGQQVTWIKLALALPDTTLADKDPWLLFLPYHALNQVDYFAVQQGEVIDARQYGSDLLFASRDVDHRYYVMALPYHGLTTVYLRIQASGVMYVPLRVMEQSLFVEKRETEHFLHGIYAGVIGAMVLYNLFLFFAVRENIYLSYIAYMVSYFLLLMANEGFGFQYIWSAYPGFNLAASPFFAALAGFFSLDFTARFLNLAVYSRLLNVLFKGARIVCVIIILLAPVLDYDLNFIVNILSICFTFFIIGASVFSYRKGCKQAYFFIIAWLFLLAGIFVFSAALNGMLPLNVVTRNALQLGSIAEVLLFSFALANRINVIKSEKNMVMRLQQQTILGLKQAELEIYEVAFKDRLTGLPNREAMNRNIYRELQAGLTNGALYLIVVHLKQLQEINKALGYKVGDDVLVKVALTLRTNCELWFDNKELDANFDGDKDLAAVEGANFVLAIRSTNDMVVERVCQRLLSLFNQPISYEDMCIDVGVSIGYSQLNSKSKDFDGLLKNAQVAVASALDKGLGYVGYTDDLDPYSQKRITLVADLKNAIQEDALQLYLQPKLCLHDNVVLGFEALLRWEHPRHGFVRPDEFIQLAEKSGVINELTDWVLKKAIGYLRFFQERDLHPHISINVSAKNLQQPYFAEHLVRVLKQGGVDVDSLKLEITETAMMDDPERALACLQHLKRQGFCLSLDDFGTGFSSLSYLSQMPIEEIKIDRAFIADIEQQQMPVIVETTLRMAKGLGLVSVAEGIETEQALKRLRALGCDIAQGFYIAKPKPFDDMICWLAAQPGYEVLKQERAEKTANLTVLKNK